MDLLSNKTTLSVPVPRVLYLAAITTLETLLLNEFKSYWNEGTEQNRRR